MKPSYALGLAYHALAIKQAKTPEEKTSLEVLDRVIHELDGDLDDLDDAYAELLTLEEDADEDLTPPTYDDVHADDEDDVD